MDPRLEPILLTTNANRAQFEGFCRALEPAELSLPVPGDPWVVRDYIAHLATIDLYVAQWFEAMADGVRWAPEASGGGPFSIDTWNEEQVRPRRDMPVDDILAEGAVLRERLLATFPRFSAETLESTFTFRDNTITFLRYLELWTLHDPAHMQDMLKALPARAADPGLRAWLESARLPEAVRPS